MPVRLFLVVLCLACIVGAGVAEAKRIVLASQSCGEGIRRPKQIVFACADHNAYADGLRWSSWGGRVAVGHGTFHYNDCIPICAGGHFHQVPITLRLYMRRACEGRSHLYYQRATLVYLGRRERGVLGCPM